MGSGVMGFVNLFQLIALLLSRLWPPVRFADMAEVCSGYLIIPSTA